MATIAVEGDARPSLRRTGATRWSPLTGIAFAVLFVVGVVASNPPGDGASATAWIANYTGSGHKASHVVTGVCLVLAGLCLASFVTATWTRVAGVSTAERISPLPVVAAAVGAACMSVGGGLMGGAITVVHSGLPADANLLRFCNDVGFIMVGLGGMLAMALSVASLSFQAGQAGVFGRRLSIAGYVVSLFLLAGLAFAPILALLVWSVVAAVTLIRS